MIKTNKEQGVYVIPCGDGYSCLGFDICLNRIEKLTKEMNLPEAKVKRGTVKAYNVYTAIVKEAQKRNKQTGWRSKSELIPEFIGKEGKRVEVIDKYGEKRRFYIGRSTGCIPCHLEIKLSTSTGGESVSGYPFQKITFLY